MTPTTNPTADVVIVGAGAGGAAVAWRLATSGLSVVCLEQGGWVPPESVPSLRTDWERARQRSHHPNPNVRNNAWDYPIDDRDSQINPLMYNAVGGSTIHWGAHFPRLRPNDFRVRTCDGVADDWPLTYDDLEPYYDLNDEWMGVAGLSGDPANPPRLARRFPPVPLGVGGIRLATAFDRLGWHWWPVDAAILTAPHANRGGCNNCGPCDLGCPTGARASTDVTYWPAALAAGVVLITQARVRRVTMSTADSASGVEYVDASGRVAHQPAGAVVLAANGIGTPRLLLLSANADHPNGLANSSDLVGRRLMHHPTALVTGVFDESLAGFMGPYAVSILSQEFYETDLERGFLRGFQMQLIRSDGPLGAALGGYQRSVPWGVRHHPEFFRQFGHTASLTVTTEDLPDPDNRVTLSSTLVDGTGLSAPSVRYRVEPNARKILSYGIEKASVAMREAGARELVVHELIASAGFHLLGTARMGHDPATSVVDAYGRSHDVRNLFIADGSLFVTAGALNPTSTLQALALRVADGIVNGGPHAR